MGDFYGYMILTTRVKVKKWDTGLLTSYTQFYKENHQNAHNYVKSIDVLQSWVMTDFKLHIL